MTRAVRVLRRVGVLVATVLVAVGARPRPGRVHRRRHVLDRGRQHAAATCVDAFLRFDLGETDGRRCGKQTASTRASPLCAVLQPGASRRHAPPSACRWTSLLLLGGAADRHCCIGVAGGRFCATHPGSPPHPRPARRDRVPALRRPSSSRRCWSLFYFSSNVSEFIRLPFLSGEGDYVAVRRGPAPVPEGDVDPVGADRAAAGGVRPAHHRGVTLREDLQEDFVRTARAKGVPERRVINRHALPDRRARDRRHDRRERLDDC